MFTTQDDITLLRAARQLAFMRSLNQRGRNALERELVQIDGRAPTWGRLKMTTAFYTCLEKFLEKKGL